MTPVAAGPRVVGVLGGMGPLATVDFMRKLVGHTPARVDQEHVPLMVASLPQIPDRTAAYFGRGPSPLRALVRVARRLEAAGAEVIVMPCNTAHLWFDEGAATVDIPMLHIVDAVLAQVAHGELGVQRLGLLATAATVSSSLYPRRGRARGLDWLVPDEEDQQRLVAAGIAAVKGGRLDDAAASLQAAAQRLVDAGAQRLVMACTESLLVLRPQDAGVPLLDATDLLALAAVAGPLGSVISGLPRAPGTLGLFVRRPGCRFGRSPGG